MTAIAADPRPTPSVRLIDGEVTITELWTRDVAVADLVSTSGEDAPGRLLDALSVGARAYLVASGSVAAHTLTDAVDQVRAILEGTAKTNMDELAHFTAHLVDPHTGVLPQAVDRMWAGIGERLAGEFDPERRDSAIGRIRQVMEAAETAAHRETLRAFNPDDPATPLGRLLGIQREQYRDVQRSVAQLGQQIVTDRATKVATDRALERSAVKGASFEETVVASVTRVATRWEDVTEPVGRVRGRAGAMTGDAVVEVAGAGRYVVEAKDRPLGLRKALAEAEQGLANRDAAASLFVYSRPEHLPSAGPFTTFGNVGIVLLEKDDPDTAALEVACAWARARVLAERSGNVGLDVKRLDELVEYCRRTLRKITDIRRTHGVAQRALEQAGEYVETLYLELTATLERMSSEVTK